MFLARMSLAVVRINREPSSGPRGCLLGPARAASTPPASASFPRNANPWNEGVVLRSLADTGLHFFPLGGLSGIFFFQNASCACESLGSVLCPMRGLAMMTFGSGNTLKAETADSPLRDAAVIAQRRHATLQRP